MNLKKPLQVTRETLMDPGFGFALSGTLVFATTSPIGFAGCLIASSIIAATKVLNVANPAFMQKDNKFTRIVKDDRTPLRVLGLAEFTVMGAVLAQNSVSLWAAAASVKDFFLSSKAWVTTFLPALASTAWAVTDLEYAADISASQKAQRDAEKGIVAPPQKKTLGQLLMTRPETPLIIGTVLMGLTAGGWSLLSLPLAVSGYGVALKNMIKKRESYKGHPNMHFSGMMGVLSAVGFATGNPLLGAGFLISTGVFARIESLTTPGGFKQVVKDIKQGFSNLLDKVTGKNKKVMTAQATPSVASEPASSLPAASTLTQSFAPEAVPIVNPDQQKPAITPQKDIKIS